MKLINKNLFIVLTLAWCVVLCVVLTGCSTPVSYDKKKVIDNSTAYIMLSQVYLNDYKEHDSNTRYDYSKGYKKEDGYFIKCYTGEYVFCLESETFDCSKTIENTYYVDDQLWEYVRVNDNFVVFGNVNGRASVIYSANDIKPSFVDDPNSIDEHIYVERIAEKIIFCIRALRNMGVTEKEKHLQLIRVEKQIFCVGCASKRRW